MKFSEACSEVDFILEHLNPDDKKKLPKYVLTFFKENKAIFYHVTLNPNQPLTEQKIKDETKAFLQILSYKYFAEENQKEQLKKLIEEDEKNQKPIIKSTYKEKTIHNNQLAIYKENKIATFFKNLTKFFKRRI